MSFVFTRDILELEKASKRCESGANLQDFDVYLNDGKRKIATAVLVGASNHRKAKIANKWR